MELNMMENPATTDFENEEMSRKLPAEILSSDSAANYIKSWPVQLPVPMKTIYIKGTRRIRRKPYRFKCSNMKNWLIPLDGPMSMDHVHFLLDCFVVSAGPVPPQLGRYHPQSDPEEFVPKDTMELSREDNWSDNSEEEDEFWSKVGIPKDNSPQVSKRETSTRTEVIGAGTSSMNSWPEEDNDTYTFEPYFPNANTKRIQRSNYTFPADLNDDFIVRELSEMRLVLERLLDTQEVANWDDPRNLREILDMLPEDPHPKEPSPHYPVGEWEFDDCGICFESQWLYRRVCCSFPACSICLQNYFSSKIDNGQVKIECCNTTCSSYVHRDEISARLTLAYKEKFHKLLILANQDANTKTCPRCSHVTKISKKPKQDGEDKFPSVTCPSCLLEWCFNCHAPWHGSLTCKQFRKGDRLLRSWARERNHGQLNAQRCPKCKIYIQRTTGCDHMHCTRCKTDFCYKCGERFRHLKFFGDHYSKLSIFGCKYRFKADQPVQRKVIRGAIFGGKLIAAPVLGALALCAGALAVGISLFALPVYGGVRLYRHCEGRQATKAVRRHPHHIHNVRHNIHNVHLHDCLFFPES
ncbi:E3 ubiquitin-protein ligase arih1l-like [Uloborus diversus]|uniref:E3 ubiquitin-protein ligase arih1l-like n=1 Tax=Uloborus diversus TaxID=327109 RepID=UPI00240A4DBD|nr:E3 ubiquitin-protein ligase arih1l-like [Uloborus diversus]